MVSQDTQDFAFSLLDASFEYSTKFYLLILAVIYLAALNFWIHNKQGDENWILLAKFFIKIGTALYFFALPLFSAVMLFRGYALIELVTLLFWGYTVASIIGLLIVFIFGWEKMLVLLGFPTLAPRLTKRRK